MLVNWQNIRFEEGIVRFDKMLLLEILFYRYCTQFVEPRGGGVGAVDRGWVWLGTKPESFDSKTHVCCYGAMRKVLTRKVLNFKRGLKVVRTACRNCRA